MILKIQFRILKDFIPIMTSCLEKWGWKEKLSLIFKPARYTYSINWAARSYFHLKKACILGEKFEQVMAMIWAVFQYSFNIVQFVSKI